MSLKKPSFVGPLSWFCQLLLWVAATYSTIIQPLEAQTLESSSLSKSAELETWADPNLPVTAGLVGWFDAHTFAQASLAQGRTAPVAGTEIELWPDASGNHFDLSQPDSTKRPKWIDDSGYQAVRFDGESDSLLRESVAAHLDSATLVIVGTMFSNAGGFRGWAAASAADRNDYVSGFNLDHGPGSSTTFEVINAEGAGFPGARDLFSATRPFGKQVRLAADFGVGENGVTIRVDGEVSGARPRDGGPISLERFVLGARYYNNGGAPLVQGEFEGDLVAVLLYDRVLTEAEHAALDRYLAERYGADITVEQPRPTDGRVPLVITPNPPRIQVLEPGFRIERLPIELTNINNLSYRHDGRLMALGYDGRIWWLDDLDQDGIEETATLFFDGRSTFRGPIGMALTPKDYPHGSGVFVPSKGKLSLIVDTDGDDIADEERVVATGWQEITQSVDALGVDVDPRDGSVWFGLGTGDYTNAYRVGSDGQAAYELQSERGTIQRIAPDLKSRATVATGIRFPVGLRFSPEGDPYVTDQEGATWLPNGNPFDELLLIEPGKHYGFPPRHPQHLPNVIDEPSLFDYGPQHQSTCGLNFNLPVLPGGPIFGPESWRGNLFVSGYSRGKLYRTEVHKIASEGAIPSHQVAANHLFACTDMLLADAVVSPRGELLLALHSGGPDWGSGPSGNGEFWRIVPEEKPLAKPVLAWASSSSEVRVAFDRPLAQEQIEGMAEGVSIEYGAFVAPGDRFESLRPGYQVVADQLRRPRFNLPIRSLQVTNDLRTLIMSVDPQVHQASHVITLKDLGRPERTETGTDRQLAESDLAYELQGIEASWLDAQGIEQWRGWLPHLDLQVARAITVGSAEHDVLWEQLSQPGTLQLKTRLDLTDLLRPAVQPGAEINYSWPEETPAVSLQTSKHATIEVLDGNATVDVETQSEESRFILQCSEWVDSSDVSNNDATSTQASSSDKSLTFLLSLPTGTDSAEVRIRWNTNEDLNWRAMPLSRFRLVWSKDETPVSASEGRVALDHPALDGGNWERGRRLFHGESLGCVKCHRFDGVGGAIGPDLSNLPFRDPDSILRDLIAPSFAVNPDHLSQAITTVDGNLLVGVVRTQDGKWIVGLADGREVTLLPEEVESVAPMPTSIMPDGLLDKVRESDPTAAADLLVYLTTVGPTMPEYAPLPVPAPRTRSEVARVMSGASGISSVEPIHILLVDGAKDHGVGEHDYPAWREMWSRWLVQAEGVTVDVARDWPTAEQWLEADTVVLFQHGTFDEQRAADVDRHFQRGGGLMLLHWAVDGGGDPIGFSRRIGLAVKSTEIKYRHGALALDFSQGANHPIARNLSTVDWYDESYWQLVGDVSSLNTIATGIEDGEARPLFWTVEPTGGRVFVSILGHYMWTFDDPLFRIVALRGLAWSAGEDVDRFMPIVESGARLIDDP